MENQDLLFVEQNPTDGKNEKIFSYSELYVASVLKRRRDTSVNIIMACLPFFQYLWFISILIGTNTNA